VTFTNVLGLIGNGLFIYSAAPELYRTVTAGKALGTPLDLILTVALGMIVMGLYTYLSHDWVLVLNYGLQFLIWGILLYYRLFRNGSPI
jgi:hypothetical protein